MSTAVVVVAPPAVATGEKRALDGAWMLSLSTAVSGGLAYAFHVLAARSLGSADYGRIAVLWAAMFLLVVVLVPSARANDVPRGRRPSGPGRPCAGSHAFRAGPVPRYRRRAHRGRRSRLGSDHERDLPRRRRADRRPRRRSRGLRPRLRAPGSAQRQRLVRGVRPLAPRGLRNQVAGGCAARRRRVQ